MAAAFVGMREAERRSCSALVDGRSGPRVRGGGGKPCETFFFFWVTAEGRGGNVENDDNGVTAINNKSDDNH